jgi:hypothetical protein
VPKQTKVQKILDSAFTQEEVEEIINPARDFGAHVARALTAFVDYIHVNSVKNEEKFLTAVDEAVVVGAAFWKEPNDE